MKKNVVYEAIQTILRTLHIVSKGIPGATIPGIIAGAVAELMGINIQQDIRNRLSAQLADAISKAAKATMEQQTIISLDETDMLLDLSDRIKASIINDSIATWSSDALDFTFMESNLNINYLMPSDLRELINIFRSQYIIYVSEQTELSHYLYINPFRVILSLLQGCRGESDRIIGGVGLEASAAFWYSSHIMPLSRTSHITVCFLSRFHNRSFGSIPG